MVVTLSGELHLKSAATRRRFLRILRRNLRAAVGHGADIVTDRPGRLLIRRADRPLGEVARAAARVFGVRWAAVATALPASSLDELATAVVGVAAPAVEGRSFAVRVRRRGGHRWRSPEAERHIGAALVRATGAPVDLTAPEVTVRVEVDDARGWVVTDPVPGADGLPLGTQPHILALISGGFDSPVAAWMMMRRGCPADFLHVEMDCSQRDHALSVAYELWRIWGHGTRPRAWVVDFSGLKEALLTHVPGGFRQVLLKQAMLAAAEQVARGVGIGALVTGDAVGQVSTQTLPNLVAIDTAHTMTVLRPLAGFTKDEIVARSREIGLHDLSARAREVCDLSTGRVETAVRLDRLRAVAAHLPPGAMDDLAASLAVVDIPSWMPGVPPAPVVREAPAGSVVLEATGQLPSPPGSPVTFRGPEAAAAATRALAAGIEAYVLSEAA